MRLLLVAGLGLCLTLSSLAADPPAGERAAALRKLRKDLRSHKAQIDKLLDAAKTPEDEAKVESDGQKRTADLTAQGLKLATDAPADAVAFAAAVWVIRNGTDEQEEAAEDVIVKHHLASPKLKEAVEAVNESDDKPVPFLKAVAGKAADPEAKGLATLYLGQSLVREADDAGLDTSKADGLLKEAEGLFEKAKKLAPDLEVGEDDTVAGLADDELYAIRKLSVGQPAPDFDGTDLDGKKAKLSGYRGKVVVLDLWATWCGPCRAMLPDNRELAKKYADKPFVFLSVSADETAGEVKEFQKDNPMPWANWWNGPDGGVLDTYRVKFFPTIYVIDAKGVIRFKNVREGDLAEAVETLMKEAEGR